MSNLQQSFGRSTEPSHVLTKSWDRFWCHIVFSLNADCEGKKRLSERNFCSSAVCRVLDAPVSWLSSATKLPCRVVKKGQQIIIT